jgi:hypothetical protein
MTSRPLVRLYAIVVGTLVFFVAWAAIAAHPWAQARASATDPRLAALSAREQRLRVESLRVRRVVAQRFARYRIELLARRRAIARITREAVRAAAPSTASAALAPPASVRIVTLPPLVITRTS